MPPDHSFAPTQLSARAAYLLRGNDLGVMTTAAPLLYPHMWSWDAAFVSIGLASLTVERAVVELDTLLSAQGKFLLSYNDHPLVWEMYDRPGIYIERVTRLNNMKQRYDGGAQFPELFVSNYDQSERIRVLPEQLSFAS